MGTLERARIAIVDDDDATRHALVFLLDVLGRPAESFSTPESFIAAGPEAFGGLILDYHMPSMTGLELARRLLQANIDISIMLMSGDLTQDIVDRAIALGVRRVAKKPPRMDDLSEFLNGVA